MNLLGQGRSDEALEAAQREPEEWARAWALAIIHHAAERDAEAQTALDALSATQSPANVAQVYAAWGEPDLAFEWLERAYDERDPGVAEMNFQPAFRGLHAHPRWRVFQRKMGLADSIS